MVTIGPLSERSEGLHTMISLVTWLGFHALILAAGASVIVTIKPDAKR
ncbi:hypothetical protein BH11MYX1_BH11MYX1_35300 [soil metagenome]